MVRVGYRATNESQSDKRSFLKYASISPDMETDTQRYWCHNYLSHRAIWYRIWYKKLQKLTPTLYIFYELL